MKNLDPQEVLKRATFKEFVWKPYDHVRAGTYKPSLVDCISAVVCASLPIIYVYMWQQICKLSWHMSIKEFFEYLLITPFILIVVMSFPFTYWIWGTVFYLRLRNEKKRFAVIQKELDRRLDGEV